MVHKSKQDKERNIKMQSTAINKVVCQYISNEYQYLVFQNGEIYRRKMNRENDGINFGTWEVYSSEPN